MDLESFTNPMTLFRLTISLYLISLALKAILEKIANDGDSEFFPAKFGENVKKSETKKTEDWHCGRISLLLSLLSFPAVSLIARWLLLRYNYDIIIVFNQKSKFISFDVSQTNLRRTRIRSGPRCDRLDPQAPFFICAFMALLYIPMSQIFAFVGFNIAERCLYPLMIPFATIIIYGLNNAYANSGKKKNYHRLFCVLSTSCLILLSIRTQNRVLDWRNDFALSKSGAEVGSVKSQVNLAVNFATQNNFQEAKNILHSSLKTTNHADIFYNL